MVRKVREIVGQSLKMPARKRADIAQRLLEGLDRIYCGRITREEVSRFDLHAAFLRRGRSDIKTFLEAFAAMMEQSLPGRVAARRPPICRPLGPKP